MTGPRRRSARMVTAACESCDWWREGTTARERNAARMAAWRHARGGHVVRVETVTATYHRPEDPR